MPVIEWRPVVGYEGVYEVSSQGDVRSLDRVLERRDGVPQTRKALPRVTHVNQRGYKQVWLTWKGVGRARPVHRLMGEAFLGAGPTDLVRHLNDVKTDNRLENLGLGTKQDNGRDRVLNGRDPNSNKTHCAQGHLFDSVNTYWSKGQRPRRQCRACTRERMRKLRNARRTSTPTPTRRAGRLV